MTESTGQRPFRARPQREQFTPRQIEIATEALRKRAGKGVNPANDIRKEEAKARRTSRYT